MRLKILFVACVASISAWGQNIRINLENDVVSRYMSEVTYTDESDASRVEEYMPQPFVRCDLPQVPMIIIPDNYVTFTETGKMNVLCSTAADFISAPVDTIHVTAGQQSVPLYHLIPCQTYYYKVYIYGILISLGEIVTEGQVRMIDVPSISNVRDIGGWKTADGHCIRYGKIFRGGELNGMHVADSIDIERLRQLGIGAELDLRADYEEAHGISAFGFKNESEVEQGEVPSYLYTRDSGMLLSNLNQYTYLYRWRQEFQFIVNNLREGRAVYQHCRWGADRTGYLSLLLEGLLGVPYEGLLKDYELTSFCYENNKTKDIIDPVISYIRELDGETLQQQFYTFWKRKVGVSQTDIDDFMSIMLDGETTSDNPTTGMTAISSMTVPATTYYDIQGRRINGQYSGLLMERQANGMTKKKMVRTYMKNSL